jgi:hypothetical protein
MRHEPILVAILILQGVAILGLLIHVGWSITHLSNLYSEVLDSRKAILGILEKLGKKHVRRPNSETHKKKRQTPPGIFMSKGAIRARGPIK